MRNVCYLVDGFYFLVTIRDMIDLLYVCCKVSLSILHSDLRRDFNFGENFAKFDYSGHE